MAYEVDGNSTVPVRVIVKDSGGDPITSTNAVEIEIKNLLVAALESVPNQAASTATVADIVTALKTIPA